MWEKLWSYDRAVVAILAAAILSVGVWLLAVALGFGEAPANGPPSYQTYFEQHNWWPYPFFYLALAPVLWLTWGPMLRAWSALARTGVLLAPDGAPDDAMVQQVLRAVHRWRGLAVALAFVIALGVNIADRAPSFAVFTGSAALDQQLRVACTYPSAALKWIFDARPADEEVCARVGDDAAVDENAPGISPPLLQILFNLVLLAQQFMIVMFVALALVQLLLHTALFAMFERLGVARANGLVMVLNANSPLNEFGLEHWNYALNNFYWAVSPAMLGVFLSRASTPPEKYLPGQALLGIAVPACLIIPMVATIIARQARLPAAWRTVHPEGPVAPEDFRRQQLWPLDRNWSSKLGIVLAFALAALAIGFELNQLMRI